MATTADALKRVPLFSNLPTKTLDRIAKLAASVSYRPGEVVIREGEAGDAFYVLTGGKVAISAGGRELAQLGPGGFFGEMALLDDRPRSATVTATADTACLTLSRADFLGSLKENPQAALELLTTLSRRVRALEDRIRHVEGSVPSEWLA